jgi:hypothetical protein
LFLFYYKFIREEKWQNEENINNNTQHDGLHSGERGEARARDKVKGVGPLSQGEKL